ncbi:hypothetical protein HETIRDRAFT_451383 [Heterobasidion irregulare TC 32-1]|uniref:Uncharacterized protein n=1 Tax=Heterobasidion irregulare (strain TC 32-1) TaxID=747525 RepID=W4K727_HETIT|nr:uncharacterized protein HETIRDRAFT_451383 [Heterobasidion irregulare TC 32-1]ETW81642.1 hypothetical protein HETIRDRAFT_451383 [Heterobasidion irregulare TC 32-1]
MADAPSRTAHPTRTRLTSVDVSDSASTGLDRRFATPESLQGRHSDSYRLSARVHSLFTHGRSAVAIVPLLSLLPLPIVLCATHINWLIRGGRPWQALISLDPRRRHVRRSWWHTGGTRPGRASDLGRRISTRRGHDFWSGRRTRFAQLRETSCMFFWCGAPHSVDRKRHHRRNDDGRLAAATQGLPYHIRTLGQHRNTELTRMGFGRTHVGSRRSSSMPVRMPRRDKCRRLVPGLCKVSVRPSKTSTELGCVKCGTRPPVITRSLARGRSVFAPSYLRVGRHGTRLGDLPGLRARVTVTVGSRVRSASLGRRLAGSQAWRHLRGGTVIRYDDAR